MQDEIASRTALGVAYMRAAHQFLDTRPLLFEDPVALKLLGLKAGYVNDDVIARCQSPYGRGLRSHVCLRSRFTEDKLQEAVRKGTKWYVLVGAGFDTFALRQPNWAKALRIVEVDHPATQAAKKEMIAKTGFELPANLSFAAADFTHETLTDILDQQNIGAEEDIYFSWLGVTMYLDKTAIDASLAAMAAASQRVNLTLTFKQPPDHSIPGEKKMGELVASIGEAFVSFFTPEEIARKLLQHGFLEQELLTPKLAQERYYTPPRSGLPSPHHAGIVHARRVATAS